MSSALVVLIYLAALVLPVFLLYHFHGQGWYWHVLAVAVALALGFVPTPETWKTPVFDIVFGFSFIFLVVWGMGGLVMFPHHHDHGQRHHA